jgi:hypothetical protein
MMLPELGCTTTRTANCPPMVAPELATTAPCPGLVEGYHRAYILTEAEALVLASRVPLRTANAERALRTPRLSSKTRLFTFSAPFTGGRSLLTSYQHFCRNVNGFERVFRKSAGCHPEGEASAERRTAHMTRPKPRPPPLRTSPQSFLTVISACFTFSPQICIWRGSVGSVQRNSITRGSPGSRNR